MERVCVKGHRPVCQSMLADPDCFEAKPGVVSCGQVECEANTCGNCEEWDRADPGRRREDSETQRVCRKAGRLVSHSMRADSLCFSRHSNVG